MNGLGLLGLRCSLVMMTFGNVTCEFGTEGKRLTDPRREGVLIIILYCCCCSLDILDFAAKAL